MRLSSPSLTAASSLPSHRLSPRADRGLISQLSTHFLRLSPSRSHTLFAPAPQRPFLNFSPSLHYLMLSISHFHALNHSYCSAPFHLLSTALSFIVAFSLHDSNNPLFSFSPILAFYSFCLPSHCFVTVAFSFLRLPPSLPYCPSPLPLSSLLPVSLSLSFLTHSITLLCSLP